MNEMHFLFFFKLNTKQLFWLYVRVRYVMLFCALRLGHLRKLRFWVMQPHFLQGLGKYQCINIAIQNVLWTKMDLASILVKNYPFQLLCAMLCYDFHQNHSHALYVQSTARLFWRCLKKLFTIGFYHMKFGWLKSSQLGEVEWLLKFQKIESNWDSEFLTIVNRCPG